MGALTVAVVGSGPIGLAALKCLLEEGFNVTAFESRDDVGGVWNYSTDAGTMTSLKDTLLNTSKYISPLSDFPFPADYPLYPSASLMHRYFRAYAQHFDLMKRIHFKSKVTKVARGEDGKWQLSIESNGMESIQVFDKVVVSNGLVFTPLLPQIKGSELFQGAILHSREYKGPEDFKNRRVVVVGIGNTAADIAVNLVNSVSEVYLSHRRGAIVLSRLRLGPPIDIGINYQIRRLMYFMEDNIPSFTAAFKNYYLRHQMSAAWEIDPSWNLQPAPSVTTTVPCVSEDLIPSLAAGSILSVKGIRCFRGPKSIELDDGTILEDVDAVIMATGYTSDMTLASWLPTIPPPVHSAPAVPRLYLQIFPPEHADSLAFLNSYNVTDCAWVVGELCAMAVAQLWAGKSAFPSRQEMDASIERHATLRARLWREGPSVERGVVRTTEFFGFLHEAAGTGLPEALGWGVSGWKFWRKERELAKLMGWGFISPHMLRVIETGKRKSWAGAREMIRALNEEAKGLDKTTKKFFLEEVRNQTNGVDTKSK